MYKKIAVFTLFLSVTISGFAQYDSVFNTSYYQQKLSQFLLIADSEEGEIIFVGDSITDIADWADIFKNSKVKNRGISGDNTYGILNRLHEVIRRKASKIFIMAGINDIAINIPGRTIISNYAEILQCLNKQTPLTRVYVQSILPTNNSFTEFRQHQGKDSIIQSVNRQLKCLALSTGNIYIDLYSLMTDKKGALNSLYTNDGLHLTGQGYMVWKNELISKKYCCQL